MKDAIKVHWVEWDIHQCDDLYSGDGILCKDDNGQFYLFHNSERLSRPIFPGFPLQDINNFNLPEYSEYKFATPLNLRYCPKKGEEWDFNSWSGEILKVRKNKE